MSVIYNYISRTKAIKDQKFHYIMEQDRYSIKKFAEHWKNLNTVKYILRVAIACTFIGHGMNAIEIKPNWIHLITVYGFSAESAKTLMPWIGVLDIIIAVLVLIHPFRAVIIWAVFWAFATALTRFIAGEGIWEFIERASNWSIPFVLLLIMNWGNKK